MLGISRLFRLSEDERIGVRVDLGRIPLRQETVELLEPYRFNPYLAPNTGGLLIAVPDGKIIMDLLADLQLPLEIIGKTTYNRDKIILSNDEKHYLERPVRPEL